MVAQLWIHCQVHNVILLHISKTLEVKYHLRGGLLGVDGTDIMHVPLRVMLLVQLAIHEV